MKHKSKKFIDEKIAEISKEKIVLDVGGGKKFQKWMAEYKDLFKNTDYKTFDFDKNSGADIMGDIHCIPIEGGTIDAIICSSVLEHVNSPAVAVEEMKRVLRPGGKIFVYVPSIYPYHARKGSYCDYWRFFDDTINLLFSDFEKVEVVKKGGYFRALSFFFPMQHKIQFFLEPISFFLDIIFNTEKRSTTAGYFIFAVKSK